MTLLSWFACCSIKGTQEDCTRCFVSEYIERSGGFYLMIFTEPEVLSIKSIRRQNLEPNNAHSHSEKTH